MEKYFGYIRVSGSGQEEGDGYARQEDAIRAFAAKKGWAISRIFKEEPISGTTEISLRPALTEAFSFCGVGTADTIIVERADRLARDLIVGELIYAEAKKAGIKIFSADAEEELVNSESDPTRVLLRQLLGALSQWEKSALVLKLRKARERMRRETGRCEGFAPVEETHPEIADMICKLKKAGKTFPEIALKFNGFKPYQRGTPAVPLPPTFRSRQWHAETIRHIYLRISKPKEEKFICESLDRVTKLVCPYDS